MGKKVWTDEERKAVAERLREGRERKAQLKHLTQEVVDLEVTAKALRKPRRKSSANLEELIRWVARVIIVRNANGRRSDQFCRCCQQSRLLKEPCRHAEVWRIAGIRPE